MVAPFGKIRTGQTGASGGQSWTIGRRSRRRGVAVRGLGARCFEVRALCPRGFREKGGVPIAGAAEVVEKYQRAFGSGDIQTARSLLADDLHFKGPIEAFTNADDYIEQH
jgi:hypothetical protein